MQCPECGAPTDVIDSRLNSVNGRVRRRRRCSAKKCSARFTTYEYAVGDPDLDGMASVETVLKNIEAEVRKAQIKCRDIIRGL